MQVEPGAILIVDDDKSIRDAVGTKMKVEGFEPVKAANGQEAFEALEERDLQLIILDLTLPDIDGVTICQRVRHDSNIPIIMLTARTEEVNRIVGLEVGADDYVTKPFSLDELVARVKAVLRRAEGSAALPEGQSIIEAGDIRIDVEGHEVTVADEAVDLTPTEFSLLTTLGERPGKVFSHKELLQKVWDYDQYDTHLVEVHIANLRGKIEDDPGDPERIVTVRSVGYKLVPQS